MPVGLYFWNFLIDINTSKPAKTTINAMPIPKNILQKLPKPMIESLSRIETESEVAD